MDKKPWHSINIKLHLKINSDVIFFGDFRTNILTAGIETAT